MWLYKCFCLHHAFLVKFIPSQDEQGSKIPKVQWVSEVGACEVKLLIPKPLFIGDKFNEESMVETKTFVEPHYASLKEGQMAQMVRFGYCRKESQKMAIYTHG